MSVTLESSGVHVTQEFPSAPVATTPLVASVEYNEAGIAGAAVVVVENFRILIDLSDIVNYKHNLTGAIELLIYNSTLGRSSAASTWEMKTGVILAMTGINVTVGYIDAGSIIADGSDPVARVRKELDYTGAPLVLRVASGAVVNAVLSDIIVEIAINSASTIKTSRLGQPTTTPGIGDIIVKHVKVMGAGTLRSLHSIRYRGII